MNPDSIKERSISLIGEIQFIVDEWATNGGVNGDAAMDRIADLLANRGAE